MNVTAFNCWGVCNLPCANCDATPESFTRYWDTDNCWSRVDPKQLNDNNTPNDCNQASALSTAAGAVPDANTTNAIV